MNGIGGGGASGGGGQPAASTTTAVNAAATSSSGHKHEELGTGELTLVNRLAESRSPYVRGHKDNPVAWQMWGPEALALAKKHNRLIFVSIGYAACHCTYCVEGGECGRCVGG
jgi:hypothetical protein